MNQLLTELDGLETRKDVYIIAATNRLVYEMYTILLLYFDLCMIIVYYN